METVNEFLPQVSLFGNVLAFWLCILGLFILLFVWDFYEKSVASISSIVIFVIIVYFWGDIKVFTFITLQRVGYYFFIGIVFALIRTFFYGNKKLEYTGYLIEPTKEEKIRNIIEQNKDLSKDLKNNVLRWWSLWPISLFNWLLTDFMRQIGSWLYDRFNKVFLYFFNLGKKYK